MLLPEQIQCILAFQNKTAFIVFGTSCTIQPGSHSLDYAAICSRYQTFLNKQASLL